MDTVHNRYGMAFTGIVEIIMSTLCSISACEIVGIRLNMVPRYALCSARNYVDVNELLI
jgi:hypothetical protein